MASGTREVLIWRAVKKGASLADRRCKCPVWEQSGGYKRVWQAGLF
jgi:hypothetical protein